MWCLIYQTLLINTNNPLYTSPTVGFPMFFSFYSYKIGNWTIFRNDKIFYHFLFQLYSTLHKVRIKWNEETFARIKNWRSWVGEGYRKLMAMLCRWILFYHPYWYKQPINRRISLELSIDGYFQNRNVDKKEHKRKKSIFQEHWHWW